MFVRIKTTATLLALPALLLAVTTPAQAEASRSKTPLEPTIPVTIDLSEMQALPGPLYISIQTGAEFQGMRGHGGIIKNVTAAMTEATYKVDVPGRYAISVWHDLDDDGVFSMADNYAILDGWGGSGDISQSARPTFAQSSFDVPAYGTDVIVKMFYPE